MMKELINKLKGDKGIWSFVALLALFSFMPVFSASSNLAYMNHGTGNTLAYLIKHLMHICLGFAIMYNFQKSFPDYFAPFLDWSSCRYVFWGRAGKCGALD